MSKITKPAGGVDVLGGAYTMYGDTGLCWSNKSNRYVGAKHQGYLAVKHNNEKFLVHRLMAHAYLGLALDSGRAIQVDHINGNKLDNRICNLQVLTHKDHVIKTHLGVKRRDYSHITIADIENAVHLSGWIGACDLLAVTNTNTLKRLYQRLSGKNPMLLQKQGSVSPMKMLQLELDFEDCWICTSL